MVQFDREDLASDSVRWTDLTPAEWHDDDERAVADLKSTGILQPFEKEYFRKDGSRVPVLLGGALFEGTGNEGVAFVLDLSEQKRAERELRRSEAFLAEGQRLSQMGSFSWRVATDEVTWSEQLYRIYELEVGVPVTLELIRTRVHPGDVSLLEQMKLVYQARTGANRFEWQYRLLMPDHSIKYLHAVAHAIRDEDGQLEYIAAVQDVTARRLSEEALDKARAQLTHVARVTSLGVLTASIAHEINQPLSGIITNANTCLRMLAADSPDVDGARETARRTIRDGNRASEVIARLRALFTNKESTTEMVDLNEATREVIALSSRELQRNRVVIQSELADDLPTITGDRIQLQQVIVNLLRNASDAMVGAHDRPRQLLIRTEREDGDRVRVMVRDTGVGFDRQSLDKLFDPFYTTKRDGMGIGLSVSRSIVERHHGRFWAEPNDGPGATFSFSIPCVPDTYNGAAPVMRHT
jgi:signal transduction histidine kinase